jgi:DnaJ-domain-containing protein 1
MRIGSLDFQLDRNRKEAVLFVTSMGRGVHGQLALVDLETLIGYLSRQADAWRRSILPEHYAVLNVPRTATAAEIKAAYRARCKEHHPDLTGADSPAMRKINESGQVLSDPERRRQYDEQCAK